jgi:valyl-tRNA synthetase
LSEEIYQNLSARKRSVHLESWPQARKDLLNKELESQVRIAKEIIEAAYRARQIAHLRLRWPLYRLVILSDSKEVLKAIRKTKSIISYMTNVKDVEVSSQVPRGDFVKIDLPRLKVFLDKKWDRKLEREAMLSELIRFVQFHRKQKGYHVRQVIEVGIEANEPARKVILKNKSKLEMEVGAKIELKRVKRGYKFKFKEFEAVVAL